MARLQSRRFAVSAQWGMEGESALARVNFIPYIAGQNTPPCEATIYQSGAVRFKGEIYSPEIQKLALTHSNGQGKASKLALEFLDMMKPQFERRAGKNTGHSNLGEDEDYQALVNTPHQMTRWVRGKTLAEKLDTIAEYYQIPKLAPPFDDPDAEI